MQSLVSAELKGGKKREVLQGEIMIAESPNLFKEKRAEERTLIDQFHSVEIFLPELMRRYLFKLRDISNGGMGIIVKNDSLILNYINVGDEREIRFHAPGKYPESLKVAIKHISESETGRYKGHHVVGISILED